MNTNESNTDSNPAIGGIVETTNTAATDITDTNQTTPETPVEAPSEAQAPTPASTSHHKFKKRVKAPGKPKATDECAVCGEVPAAHKRGGITVPPKAATAAPPAPTTTRVTPAPSTGSRRETPEEANNGPAAVVNYMESLKRLRNTVDMLRQANHPDADTELDYLLDAATAWPRYPLGEVQGTNNRVYSNLLAWKRRQLEKDNQPEEPVIEDSTPSAPPTDLGEEPEEPITGPFTTRMQAICNANLLRAQGFSCKEVKRERDLGNGQKEIYFEIELSSPPTDETNIDTD